MAAGASGATAVLPPPASQVEVKDEPVQSGGGDEVPPMPPGAFVKEEGGGVVPSMPSVARWGVEDPMPMPSEEEEAEEEAEDRYATQWSPTP